MKDILIIITVFFSIFLMFSSYPSNVEFTANAPINRYLIATEATVQDIIYSKHDKAHTPLIYLIYKPYLLFLNSIDETLISIPTYIFFVSSLTAFFFVSYKMFGILAGLLSTTVLMQNPFIPQYITGIEDMFLFIFFAILTTYSLYMFFIKKKKIHVMYLLIFNTLMLWSYRAAVFFILGEMLYIIFNQRKWIYSKSFKRFCLFFIILSAPVLINFVTFTAAGEISNTSKLNDKYENIWNFFEGILQSTINLDTSTNIIFILLRITIILGITVSIVHVRNKEENKILAFLLIPFLIIIPLLLNRYTYFERYSLSFVWIMILMVGSSISEISSNTKMKKVLITIILLLIIATNIELTKNQNHETKNDVKRISEEFIRSDLNSLYVEDVHFSNFCYYTADSKEEFISRCSATQNTEIVNINSKSIIKIQEDEIFEFINKKIQKTEKENQFGLFLSTTEMEQKLEEYCTLIKKSRANHYYRCSLIT